jgi:hypothetical protein
MESKVDPDNFEKWARSECLFEISKIYFEVKDGFKIQAIQIDKDPIKLGKIIST